MTNILASTMQTTVRQGCNITRLEMMNRLLLK